MLELVVFNNYLGCLAATVSVLMPNTSLVTAKVGHLLTDNGLEAVYLNGWYNSTNETGTDRGNSG